MEERPYDNFTEVNLDFIKTDKLVVKSYFKFCPSSLNLSYDEVITKESIKYCRIYSMDYIHKYQYFMIVCPNDNIIICQDIYGDYRGN